jgi:hypothetical protein
MSNKTIINTTNASGLSNITTLTMPSSSTDCEIVIWDGTSGNSIAGGHDVTISAYCDIKNVNSIIFDNAAIVRWNRTTGTIIQNSTVLLSDTNRFTVSGQILLYADLAKHFHCRQDSPFYYD